MTWPLGLTPRNDPAGVPRLEIKRLVVDAVPLTVKSAPGFIVPMPTLPVLKIVSLAVFDGPIIVEQAMLFVMFEPKTEEYRPDAVLQVPKAEELQPEAV